jgi:hypothetical protein
VSKELMRVCLERKLTLLGGDEFTFKKAEYLLDACKLLHITNALSCFAFPTA